MTLPAILVIDDQYPNDIAAWETFLEKTNLFDEKLEKDDRINPIATASICSGQQRSEHEILNDYEVIRQAVTEGAGFSSEHWALVLLDVCFDSGPLDEFGLPKPQPGDDHFGEEVRKRLAVDFPELPVVMLTSKKESELADLATPYLSKTGLTPNDVASRLLQYGRLTSEQQRTLLCLPPEVVIRSPLSFAVFQKAFSIAASKTSVLILGDTGTGKEVLARYIHSRSMRAEAPFVPVNVAALPAELVESILFGHEKGAFTGADRKRTGLFAQASGGTLFLDEIGDMPPSLQTKVLRALQDGEVLPVGAPESVQVDVRIISATSRDLNAMRQKDHFREDLIRRISGETLLLPPLRERQEDIVALAEFFLHQISMETGKEGIEFQDNALQVLQDHPFTGNVGELQYIVRSLVNRKSPNSLIAVADVREALAASFISADSTLPAPKSAESDPGPAVPFTIDQLVEMLESWPVSLDDPGLQGGKPRLELSMGLLLNRMAGAALERFRDPRNSKLNRQAAMQWFMGDDTLKGKGPGRVLNELLGRRADSAITDDDLAELVTAWQEHNK